MTISPPCVNTLVRALLRPLVPAVPTIVLFLAMGVQGVELAEVVISKVPRITDNRMVYTLDMVLDKVPADYWAFYDPKRSSIVVDVYGDTVRNTVRSIERNLVFSNMQVRNLSTAMSLSGMRSQVRFDIDRGWEVNAVVHGTDTLRLSVSRAISVQSSRKKAPQRWSAFAITTAIAGLASAAVLALLNRSSS